MTSHRLGWFVISAISRDLLFSFSGCGDHRALHSFPTRRSSDLAGVAPTAPSGRIPSWRPPSSRPSPAASRGSAWRSEEQRLNSSHVAISYAVFCLKKKTEEDNDGSRQQ